ncbi:MAG: HIRAN domain-containing protein [Byssovorax sp.]
MFHVPHQVTVVEGRHAVWLTGDYCARQEVAGEAFNGEQVNAVFHQAGQRVGVPLVAWLAPEPTNPHDPNAVLVWVGGGKVGYLPREDAPVLQPMLVHLQRSYGLPVACHAHLELPPEDGRETTLQVVLWLPAVPGLDRPWHPQAAIASIMTKAQAEPRDRAWRAAERQRLDAEVGAESRRRAALAAAESRHQAANAAAESQRQAELDAARARRDEERAKREAETRADHARRSSALSERFGPDIAQRILARELWQGQTREQLEAAFGEPASINERVMKTKVKHTLDFSTEGPCSACNGEGRLAAYAHIENGRCFTCRGTGRVARQRTRVTLENGVVVGWQMRS